MFFLNGHPPILIIDSDANFLEALKAQPYAPLNPPATARNHGEARRQLTTPSRSFSGIFLNMKLREIEIVSLMHTIHQLHIGTPVFAIFDHDGPASFTRQLRKLGFHESLHKPLSFMDLMATVAPLQQENDPKPLKSPEFAAPASDFVPIPIRCLTSGVKSLFDVYAGTDGKYRKIAKVGTVADGKQLSNYLESGIQELFILKQDQQAYIDHCETLLCSMSRAEAITLPEASDFASLQPEPL